MNWARGVATSAGGLEVGSGVALDHAVLGVSGMPVVRLPAAVGVGATALGHAHGEFGATSTTGGEHRVFDLATGVGDEQVKLGGGGNVEHGVMVVDVASIQGQGSSCNHLQPGDGFARGEAPDDHGGPAVIDRPIEGDVPSGVQIGGELSTVLIEGAEGLGLNGEGHEVRSFDL